MQELNATISDFTAELTKASETKQELELEYSNKCQAFQSLSAQFLAEKVSFEVGRRNLYATIGDAVHESAVYAKTVLFVCLSVTLVMCQKTERLNIVYNFRIAYTFSALQFCFLYRTRWRNAEI